MEFALVKLRAGRQVVRQRIALIAIVVLGGFANLSVAGDKTFSSFSCRVFLVPGAFGAGTSSLFLKAEDYFSEYRAFFESKSCAVKMAEFPPDATIESRALILKDQLSRFARTPVIAHAVAGASSKLFLIAHSQGALDSRFALRTLGLPPVDALISIGAPHSGTPVAQWAVDHRERGSLIYWILRMCGYDLRALSFAGEMTPEFLEKHLIRFEKVPSVRYASGEGVCRTDCHWGLRLLARWISWRGTRSFAGVGPGQGDGVVPLDSQIYGDDLGEYDLDHISEVGVDPVKRPERARFLARVWEYLNR